jgi:HPt (histidine-containing phosphotransfer) domain-containing protein
MRGREQYVWKESKTMQGKGNRERTEDLSKVKEHLEAEVVERKRAEAALQIKARELEFLNQRLSEMRQALREAREELERWMPSRQASEPAAPAATSAEAAAVDPIDLTVWAKLNELGTVGRDVVGEVGELFMRQAPSQIEAVRVAVSEYDALGLEWAAHTLKGSCADVGALHLSTLCKELEAISRIGSVEEAREQLALVEAEYHHVQQALETKRRAA